MGGKYRGGKRRSGHTRPRAEHEERFLRGEHADDFLDTVEAIAMDGKSLHGDKHRELTERQERLLKGERTASDREDRTQQWNTLDGRLKQLSREERAREPNPDAKSDPGAPAEISKLHPKWIQQQLKGLQDIERDVEDIYEECLTEQTQAMDDARQSQGVVVREFKPKRSSKNHFKS